MGKIRVQIAIRNYKIKVFFWGQYEIKDRNKKEKRRSKKVKIKG